MKSLFIIALIVVFAISEIPHYTKQQITQKIGQTKIMYGATIRIRAALFPFHLHSHLVNYPRGSGYQSVTGMPDAHDYNSLWVFKQPYQQNPKNYDDPVLCGDSIRLQHALTKRNLHSEQIFQSMITSGQQVSAFGNNGNGDDNDNWILKCVSRQEGQNFYGNDLFQLVHENTQKYLKMSRYYQYNFGNWENCPFQGQLQVSATDSSTKQSEFRIVGGIFFQQKPKDKQQSYTNEQL